MRCNTSDIFPTLLEITGAKIERQLPLDGVSLVPLIDGKLERRPVPMGFWDFRAPGIRTPSKEWMTELLEAQKAGREANRERLRLDAGTITKHYSEEVLPGWSAWIDGDWKLHRRGGQAGKNVRFELYDLAKDPGEKNDLAGTAPERVEAMKAALEKWQRSVLRSLNGEDY